VKVFAPVPPRATPNVPVVICSVSIAIGVFAAAETRPYASTVNATVCDALPYEPEDDVFART
jgi:hypothetical protein